MQFAGKVAVITGGASGIGFATAKALAAKGVKLVLADIEAAALEKAATELTATGTRVESVVCDVSKLMDVERLAETAFLRLGAVHIVFNYFPIADCRRACH